MMHAVWLTEYPDEGSMHVEAETGTEALEKGAAALGVDLEEEDRPELSVAPVTAAEHAAWLASQ